MMRAKRHPRRKVGAGGTAVELMVDQVVQGVLEVAGQEQSLQINGNEAQAGVDGFVAGHESLSERTAPWSLVIPFGSRHDARMKRLFLQLRWAS